MVRLPPFQHNLPLRPIRQASRECLPELRAVVAVTQVGDFVGDDVLHRGGWRLDEPPVDADDTVLPERAPAALGFGEPIVLSVDA